MHPLWLVLALALVAIGVAAVRGVRARRLAAVRAAWGQPIERTRKLDAILESHRARIVAHGGRSLDDRTWADLDMDAVFAALDRTVSTLGQHALYHRLRTAPAAADLDQFDALANRMSADPPARERAQFALGRLLDPHGYDLWWLARADALETQPWFAIFPLLTLTTLAALIAAPFWPAIIPAVVALCGISVVVRANTDSRITALASAFRQMAPIIATGEALRFLRGADIDPIVAPLESDVPRLAGLKATSRWVSGDWFMLSVSPNPIATAVSDVITAAYEYLNLVLVLDATGVYLGAGLIRRHGTELLRLVATIGDIDAAISVASYRAERGDWTRPIFHHPGAAIALAAIRHPLVADAVPNSVDLAAGHGLLVTGSNMSGKSTFLRTTGVTIVMAQTINTCLASAYVAPRLEVRSAIGRSDDLLAGKSYYIAEVEALLALVAAAREDAPHLFLLDELFRGTNTVERIAAGQAVLAALVAPSGRPRHGVVAATHDREIIDLLPGTYSACHFGDAVSDEGLVFDHRLRPGPSTTRNAIALLRIHGAPPALVASALACAEQLDADVHRDAATAAPGETPRAVRG